MQNLDAVYTARSNSSKTNVSGFVGLEITFVEAVRSKLPEYQ